MPTELQDAPPPREARRDVSRETEMAKQEDHDREAAENRGKRAVPGSGEVKGSGAGAGGGGNPEDFDSDTAAGGDGPQPDSLKGR